MSYFYDYVVSLLYRARESYRCYMGDESLGFALFDSSIGLLKRFNNEFQEELESVLIIQLGYYNSGLCRLQLELSGGTIPVDALSRVYVCLHRFLSDLYMGLYLLENGTEILSKVGPFGALRLFWLKEVRGDVRI